MTDFNQRLERLKPILACPACQCDLDYTPDTATCTRCQGTYPIKQEKIYFVAVPDRVDELDKLKGLLKKWLGQSYYTVGRDVIAPTYPFNFRGRILKRLDPTQKIVIDVGCGNYRMDENIITLDFFDYEAVDVVCDVGSLPFKSDSVDAFVSRSVLEHIVDISVVIQQFNRCTQPGGLGMHLIPFLFPFHASPHDFQRYTHKGQRTLFKGWEVIEQTNSTGPVTLGLVCLIEFFSILFSFGQKKIKSGLTLIFCLLLFPLKFLDFPFVNRKSFFPLAPTLFIVVRKPGV
jgi:SAM-dependent methyltransferase